MTDNSGSPQGDSPQGDSPHRGSSRGGPLGGIRLYLIGLALLVALPLAALSLVRILSLNADAAEETDREATRLGRLVAARVDERVRTADALLLGLSAEIIASQGRRARNDSLLAATLALTSGRYANLFVIDTLGTVQGTSRPLSEASRAPGAYASRHYLRTARERGGFVVGEVLRSRVLPDSNWVVILARALVGGDGRFAGVVAISMRLDSLGTVAEATELPGTPVVTIFDSTGLVIARSKDADRYVGTQRVHVATPRRVSGVARIRSFDGEMRVVGYMRSASAPWMVNVGLLESATTAVVRARLINDLLLFGAAATFAVLIAWLVAQRIAVPLTRLTEDARTITRGVSGQRAIADGPREIRALGEAFNQMADTVERRSVALADSERRYRLLFDSNPLPMWAWDAESRALLAVNEAAIDKYGYDRDEFLRLQITDLLHPTERERFAASRLPFSETRQGAGTWKHQAKDGSLIEMDVITTSSRRLGRASWLSVGIDVTARRVAERALAASEEQLRQSQKMEAIGAFAGGIAHDFNNLLTGMLGYCDLALGGIEPTQEAHADIEEIRALALRGADLTRQILAVSRKQVVQPTYIDPNDVVRGLNRLLRRVIGEHITFHALLTDPIGSVFADAGQLEQTLLNLAANARDAMPKGGTLEITTRVLPPNEVASHALTDGAWVAISVRDTGTGMSEDVRQRIFEPFFTTKERGKGTGLGLALAYAMMEQAGGEIRVESTPGEGTVFHLLLPRHQRAAPSRSDESVGVATLRGTETILVAEDEDSVRAVTTAALASRGYNVLAATDGEAALALARQYPQRIDVLVTDVVMPGMNGRELAEAMLAERDDLRVLFVSGYTDDVSLLQGISTDELSFLQKPFSPAELVRRVRDLLDAGVRVG